MIDKCELRSSNGGRSRSASVVIAFLMSTLDMEYDQVLQQLRATRSIIAPNKGAWVGVTIYAAGLFAVSVS